MSDNLQRNPEVILCNMCTEDRKPAWKTCMKCELSMCLQHIQAHLTTPVLRQTHPLTEPMASCVTTKCPQHGKLLEYYCLDDMTSLCVYCAIDQHRLHNMKTFSIAHKELMERLNAELQALLVMTDDENVSLEKWEKSEREKLSHSSMLLIQAVTGLRDIALTSVQSSVSARMVSIKTSTSNLQAALKEEDTVRFLQMYSQVHQDLEKAKSGDLRKGLEPGSDRDKLVQEIEQNGEKIVEQAGQFWASLLSLVDPENHQELIATNSSLVFHPQAFGNNISLSKDNRKVYYSGVLGQCSATLFIRSNLSPHNFQRWTVRLTQDSAWTIGLCDKHWLAEEVKDGEVYGLRCEGKKLSSLTTHYDECGDASASSDGFEPQKTGTTTAEKQRRVSTANITQQGKNGAEAAARPEMVEVFWNVDASSLSFYRRTRQHQREEIITIKMNNLNNQNLAPFVQLHKDKWQQMPNLQWRCSCGKNYQKNAKGYTYILRQYSHQGTCSCGATIGLNTEVVCELQ